MVDPYVSAIRPVTPSAEGCEDCLRIGSPWGHLRLCLTCGHVGCCDSSPNRHARKHYFFRGHPVIQSFEAGEDCGGATSPKRRSKRMECWSTGVGGSKTSLRYSRWI